MGAFVEGVLHLRFNATFFQAHLFPFVSLRCFQVEAKVGILPNHEKHFPPWLYPGHIMLPQVEDNVWGFYLSMENIAHTCSTLVGILY